MGDTAVVHNGLQTSERCCFVPMCLVYTLAVGAVIRVGRSGRQRLTMAPGAPRISQSGRGSYISMNGRTAIENIVLLFRVPFGGSGSQRRGFVFGKNARTLPAKN